MGTIKHSLASKKRRSKIPRAKLLKEMANLGRLRWQGMSQKERDSHIKKMVRARQHAYRK